MDFVRAQYYLESLRSNVPLSVGKGLHKYVIIYGHRMEFDSFCDYFPDTSVFGDVVQKELVKAISVMDRHFVTKQLDRLDVKSFQSTEDYSAVKPIYDWKDGFLHGTLTNSALSKLGPAITPFLVAVCKSLAWRAVDCGYIREDDDVVTACRKSMCLMKIFTKVFVYYREWQNVLLPALSGFEFSDLTRAYAALVQKKRLLDDSLVRQAQPGSEPLGKIAELLGCAGWHANLLRDIGGSEVSGFVPGDVIPHQDLADFILESPLFSNVYNVRVPGFNGCVYISIAFVVACKRQQIEGLDVFLSKPKAEHRPKEVCCYEAKLEDRKFVCDNLQYLIENSSQFPRFMEFAKVKSALEKFSSSDSDDPRVWSKLRESDTLETDVVATVESMLWVELTYSPPKSAKRSAVGDVNILHTAVDIEGHAPAVGVLATQMGTGHCSILLCPVRR